MNSLAKKYYEVGGESDIQEVIFLSEQKALDWKEVSEKVSDMPRGWFELSRVSKEDRIEFISTIWENKLPFHPMIHARMRRFFSRLDDVAIVIVKREFSYFAEMVYSIGDNSSFFRGLPPLIEEDVRMFTSELGVRLPSDYLSFLKVHNGFGKLSEPGILRVEEIYRAREDVRKILMNGDKEIRWKGHVIDPEALIPFYEDYGFNSFQCFFSDWYPNSEMGNVYLSGINYTVSDIADRNIWADQLAFASFMEWLAMYLEGMNVLD